MASKLHTELKTEFKLAEGRFLFDYGLRRLSILKDVAKSFGFKENDDYKTEDTDIKFSDQEKQKIFDKKASKLLKNAKDFPKKASFKKFIEKPKKIYKLLDEYDKIKAGISDDTLRLFKDFKTSPSKFMVGKDRNSALGNMFYQHCKKERSNNNIDFLKNCNDTNTWGIIERWVLEDSEESVNFDDYKPWREPTAKYRKAEKSGSKDAIKAAQEELIEVWKKQKKKIIGSVESTISESVTRFKVGKAIGIEDFVKVRRQILNELASYKSLLKDILKNWTGFDSFIKPLIKKLDGTIEKVN